MARGRGRVMEEFASGGYSKGAGLVPWLAAVSTVVSKMCVICFVLCSGLRCSVECRTFFSVGMCKEMCGRATTSLGFCSSRFVARAWAYFSRCPRFKIVVGRVLASIHVFWRSLNILVCGEVIDD